MIVKCKKQNENIHMRTTSEAQTKKEKFEKLFSI